MFSGIVETQGLVQAVTHHTDHSVFEIVPSVKFDDVIVGDSVAVNGVCLTVTNMTDEKFYVTAVPETLRLTNLGEIAVDEYVNLERSMKLNSRIGGHYVQGHVDGVGEIVEITPAGSQALMTKIAIPPMLEKYLVNKGYVTLDGMSITVIQAEPAAITVTFIPHTQAISRVQGYKKGTKINIEVDILGKYIEKLMEARL